MNNILSSNGAYAPGLLIQIVVMKVIATSICRGSGLQASPAWQPLTVGTPVPRLPVVAGPARVDRASAERTRPVKRQAHFCKLPN